MNQVTFGNVLPWSDSNWWMQGNQYSPSPQDTQVTVPFASVICLDTSEYFFQLGNPTFENLS